MPKAPAKKNASVSNKRKGAMDMARSAAEKVKENAEKIKTFLRHRHV